ncbi:unnamed protein product [Caenorhabditis brenneri]
MMEAAQVPRLFKMAYSPVKWLARDLKPWKRARRSKWKRAWSYSMTMRRKMLAKLEPSTDSQASAPITMGALCPL